MARRAHMHRLVHDRVLDRTNLILYGRRRGEHHLRSPPAYMAVRMIVRFLLACVFKCGGLLGIMSTRKTTPATTAPAAPMTATAPEASTPMRFTKRFNVLITGTMANFEADGPSVAEWRPVEGQHVKMFTNASAEQDLGSATKILQNTWLLSARVIEHKNTFPVPLGINVSCIAGQEHIDTGENYTFTALPMTHNPTPLSIFEADASAQTSQEWRRMYGEYNERNLDSHNVLLVANQNYVFVHENHPIISLLKVNSDLLGSEVSDDKRIDGEWFKVSKSVVSTCCNTLRTKVLKRFACKDFNTLAVNMKRLDAKEWTQESDLLSEAMSKNPNILTQPCSFMARIEMTYELQN